MEKKIEITILGNDEGFVGSGDTTGTDIKASYDLYMTFVKKAIKKIYPNAVVAGKYGNYSGASILIDIDGDNVTLSPDGAEIISDVTDVLERVYNSDSFWVSTKSSSAALMGRTKSPAKAAASRENGKKGGRPRK